MVDSPFYTLLYYCIGNNIGFSQDNNQQKQGGLSFSPFGTGGTVGQGGLGGTTGTTPANNTLGNSGLLNTNTGIVRYKTRKANPRSKGQNRLVK